MTDEFYEIIWVILECYVLNLFHIICHEFGHAMMAYSWLSAKSTMSLSWAFGWCVGGMISFEPIERRKRSVDRLRRQYGRYGKYIYRAKRISVSLAGPMMGILFLIVWHHYSYSVSYPLSLCQRYFMYLLLLNQLYNLFPISRDDYILDGYLIARELQISVKTLTKYAYVFHGLIRALDALPLCGLIIELFGLVIGGPSGWRGLNIISNSIN